MNMVNTDSLVCFDQLASADLLRGAVLPMLIAFTLLLQGCDTAGDRRSPATTVQTPVSTDEITQDPVNQEQIPPQEIATQTDTAITATTPVTSYSASQIASFNDSRVPEISGLAVSRQTPGRLWAINDSGQTPMLHALSTNGDYIAGIQLSIDNRDWEDLASFTLLGEHYLMIAETGDNLSIHPSYTLHFFIEPQIDNAIRIDPLSPIASMEFIYEDGAHDAEAVAVSTTDNRIYIVSKEETPSLYELPLELGNSGQTFSAARVARMPDIAQSAGDIFVGNLVGVDLSSITALDIDNARGLAWLLTYRGVFKVQRSDTQSWADALGDSNAHVKTHAHAVAQGEALATDETSGNVYFTSEKLPAPLWQLSPQ